MKSGESVTFGHQLVLEIVTSIAFRVCVSFFGMWKPTKWSKCKVIRLSWKPGINRNPGFFRIQVFVPKFGISKLQRSNQGWPGNWLTWIFWTWTQNLHRVHSLDLKFQVTKAFEVPIGIIIGTDFFSFLVPKMPSNFFFLGKSEAISRSTTPNVWSFHQGLGNRLGETPQEDWPRWSLREMGKGPFPNKETVMVMSWSNAGWVHSAVSALL